MPTTVFLDGTHWAWLLKSVHQEVLDHGQPPSGPLGQLWKLLGKPNRQTIFD
jgi:hypothetical protein